MEVKINNSIDIQRPSKKKRPRIAETKVVEDSSAYVKSVEASTDVVTSSDKNKSSKKNFKKKEFTKKPSRTLDDIKNSIIKSLESTGGKYIKVDDINHTEGILVCAVVDDEKHVKFAIIDHNRDLVYVDHFNKFAVMREPSLKCSILDWLYRNETATIVDNALDALEFDGYEVFTETYLVVPKKKEEPKKKSKKKNKRKEN